MTPFVFAIVDVFADTGFGGNPHAVVLDTDRLPDHVLRQIAGEFNLSETTFVLAPRTPGSTRRLRSFTAASAEVTGAGHNALGAWWWLASTARTQTGALRQELGDAVLHLRVSQGARQAGRGDEAAAPDALRGGRHRHAGRAAWRASRAARAVTIAGRLNGRSASAGAGARRGAVDAARPEA
jgi:trans-2,3-dihydro-3-hydroxyanthranilate isomerase